MNELPKIADHRVLAELRKIVESNTFTGKARQKELLTYLVVQTLAGKEPDEPTIAEDVFHFENFMADKKGTVRVAVRDLRGSLAKYYSNEGAADPVWILLPRGKYTPVFEEHRTSPVLEGKLSRPPAPGGRVIKRWPLWAKLLIAVAAPGMVCAGAAIVWLGQKPECSGSISILKPNDGATVGMREVVVAARVSRRWYCRCGDYLVVEPVDSHQLWVQGRLPEGPNPSLTAYFGDSKTDSGTRFSVFVLSSRDELPIGPLSQDSPYVATAAKSVPLIVSRTRY